MVLFVILSSLFKYIFIAVIYFFIFAIIRLIYLDIKSMNAQGKGARSNSPYLKLINRREHLYFKIQETYILHGDMTIGRINKNNISFNDPFLSTNHARLVLHNDKYLLEDADSTNGTTVNGEKISNEGIYLKDGDKIHVGQVDFLFVDSIDWSENHVKAE